MLIVRNIPKDVAHGRQGVSEGYRHGSVLPRVTVALTLLYDPLQDDANFC